MVSTWSPKQFRKRLADLMNQPENQTCCDCSATSPSWACIITPPIGSLSKLSLGAFCCMECAASHRRLGVHITFVRSVKLDEWKEREVRALEYGGNKVVNEIFEAKYDTIDDKPLPSSDSKARYSYIEAKYEKRKYFDGAIFNSHCVRRKEEEEGENSLSPFDEDFGTTSTIENNQHTNALNSVEDIDSANAWGFESWPVANATPTPDRSQATRRLSADWVSTHKNGANYDNSSNNNLKKKTQGWDRGVTRSLSTGSFQSFESISFGSLKSFAPTGCVPPKPPPEPKTRRFGMPTRSLSTGSALNTDNAPLNTPIRLNRILNPRRALSRLQMVGETTPRAMDNEENNPRNKLSKRLNKLEKQRSDSKDRKSPNTQRKDGLSPDIKDEKVRQNLHAKEEKIRPSRGVREAKNRRILSNGDDKVRQNSNSKENKHNSKVLKEQRSGRNLQKNRSNRNLLSHSSKELSGDGCRRQNSSGKRQVRRSHDANEKDHRRNRAGMRSSSRNRSRSRSTSISQSPIRQRRSSLSENYELRGSGHLRRNPSLMELPNKYSGCKNNGELDHFENNEMTKRDNDNSPDRSGLKIHRSSSMNSDLSSNSNHSSRSSAQRDGRVKRSSSNDSQLASNMDSSFSSQRRGRSRGRRAKSSTNDLQSSTNSNLNPSTNSNLNASFTSRRKSRRSRSSDREELVTKQSSAQRLINRKRSDSQRRDVSQTRPKSQSKSKSRVRCGSSSRGEIRIEPHQNDHKIRRNRSVGQSSESNDDLPTSTHSQSTGSENSKRPSKPSSLSKSGGDRLRRTSQIMQGTSNLNEPGTEQIRRAIKTMRRTSSLNADTGTEYFRKMSKASMSRSSSLTASGTDNVRRITRNSSFHNRSKTSALNGSGTNNIRRITRNSSFHNRKNNTSSETDHNSKKDNVCNLGASRADNLRVSGYTSKGDSSPFLENSRRLKLSKSGKDTDIAAKNKEIKIRRSPMELELPCIPAVN